MHRCRSVFRCSKYAEAGCRNINLFVANWTGAFLIAVNRVKSRYSSSVMKTRVFHCQLMWYTVKTLLQNYYSLFWTYLWHSYAGRKYKHRTSFPLVCLYEIWHALVPTVNGFYFCMRLLVHRRVQLTQASPLFSSTVSVISQCSFNSFCDLKTISIAISSVAYLLKARNVEAEKQPLLSNGPYTCSRGIASRTLWRHATIEVVLQAAFSVGPRRARCYATVR
jgi:hypothetical protein